jgi:putative membrane protein
LTYLWLKALHIIAMVAWMAGLFYLPRLFVYHADTAVGSEKSETFKVMERRLLRAITTPAMIATWVFGLLLVWVGDLWSAPWLHVKLVFVVALTAFNGWLSLRCRDFAGDRNRVSSRTYRMVNEVPTVLLIVIVLIVVLKPF